MGQAREPHPDWSVQGAGRTGVPRSPEGASGPHRRRQSSAATRGNHGQSLAFAGRAFDVPDGLEGPRAPTGTADEKNAAMEGFRRRADRARAATTRRRGSRPGGRGRRARGYGGFAVPSRPRLNGVGTLRLELFRAAGRPRRGVRAGRDGLRPREPADRARPARPRVRDRRRDQRASAVDRALGRRGPRGRNRVGRHIRRRRRLPSARRGRDRDHARGPRQDRDRVRGRDRRGHAERCTARPTTPQSPQARSRSPG